MPQQDVANDWQQSADSSSVDQTHKAKLRRLPRLHSVVVALKDSIKRSAARVHQNHDQEERDSWDYDAISQMSSWKNPRDAVSLFSAKTRDIKNHLKSWTRIKKDRTLFQPDSNWETDNWEIESWNPATTLEADPRLYGRLNPKLLDFVAPLQESSSTSQSSQEKSFLRHFLSERRSINIHPERKHRLAMFSHRTCEEASFAYVAVQEPLALSILRVYTPDQVEFSVEGALEELYHDECARKSNQDVLLSSEKTVGHDQVSTGRPSTEGKVSSDGSATTAHATMLPQPNWVPHPMKRRLRGRSPS
ncbi:MAG: hypothetical protein Q9194_001492 [Teloschistes cf. exilis]